MPPLPNTLALENVEDGSSIIASEHRNNYSAIQTAVNALLGILDDGTAGQALLGVGTTLSFGFPSPPSARAYHNAAQSIANATNVALAFNSERFDTDTIHDTATNNSRLTCKTAGKYLVNANVSFAANATGFRQLTIVLNGVTEIAALWLPNQGAGLATTVVVSTLYDLAVNDYIQAFAYQTSGGALDVSVVGNYSPEFSMVKVA